ncbi:hypothetical protein SV7mr_21910 [Stieleria bergensis]|uniref:DUF6985 domain-containing protein n=1 Tax=Stieleria bergensis TaxID=2528025 RepID=A0A517SU82_9BACT|nr:hypothetical protein SV7mr_21910 [Planctomycetes bacterium SV_7m_r]
MTSKPKLEFPVGTLQWVAGDLWQMDDSCTLFGKRFSIKHQFQIDIDEGLEPEQISAHQYYTANQPKVIAICERAIREYSESEEVQAISGSDTKICASAQTVTPLSILFPYAEPFETFGMLCDCVWDIDNGLAVRFEKHALAAIGTQNILL